MNRITIQEKQQKIVVNKCLMHFRTLEILHYLLVNSAFIFMIIASQYETNCSYSDYSCHKIIRCAKKMSLAVFVKS